MAFVAAEGKRSFVSLDGREYDVYGPDWILGWPPAWSDDGAVIAFRLTHRSTGKDCIGIDGRRGPEFDRVGPPALSRDGRRVAYRAQRGERSVLVVDGVAGPDAEFMSDPAISADGRVVAWAAREDGRWWLHVGSDRAPLDARPASLFLSADGRLAGRTEDVDAGGGATFARVVAGGGPGPTFTRTGRPVFAPDGRTLAYGAEDGERRLVVIGGRAIETPNRSSDPVFSPDGRKVGYGARTGRELRWKTLDVP